MWLSRNRHVEDAVGAEEVEGAVGGLIDDEATCVEFILAVVGEARDGAVEGGASGLDDDELARVDVGEVVLGVEQRVLGVLPHRLEGGVGGSEVEVEALAGGVILNQTLITKIQVSVVRVAIRTRADASSRGGEGVPGRSGGCAREEVAHGVVEDESVAIEH